MFEYFFTAVAPKYDPHTNIDAVMRFTRMKIMTIEMNIKGKVQIADIH